MIFLTADCGWSPPDTADISDDVPWSPNILYDLYHEAPWNICDTHQNATSQAGYQPFNLIDDESLIGWESASGADHQGIGTTYVFALPADEQIKQISQSCQTTVSHEDGFPWDSLFLADIQEIIKYGQTSATDGQSSARWHGTHPSPLLHSIVWAPGQQPYITPAWRDNWVTQPPEDTTQTITIQIKTVYAMLHSASVVLLPSGNVIPCSSVSVAIDSSAWCWSLSATVSSNSALAAIRALSAPVNVQVTMNGKSWIFTLDEWSRSRAFSNNAYSITGRSSCAVLAIPGAGLQHYSEPQDRDASQLVDKMLEYSGISCSWGIDDWIVTGGAFSYTASTPMAQIVRIAQAAGGMVQPHQTASSISILPTAPGPYWTWGSLTPNVSIPISAMLSMQERSETRPAYDSIWVQGQAGGISGHVVRTGYAGAISMPSIVDPLITDIIAARQRGVHELNKGGNIVGASIAMPFLAGNSDPGVIKPGSLLSITDTPTSWRGLVTSTSISASVSGNALTIRQTLNVERHV